MFVIVCGNVHSRKVVFLPKNCNINAQESLDHGINEIILHALKRNKQCNDPLTMGPPI